MDSVSDSGPDSSTPDLKKSRRKTANYTIDRLPPHALDMERGILGCCLISPKECIAECMQELRSDGPAGPLGSHFYDLRHQTIWETLAEMFNARQEIDIITVQQKLKDNQLLDQVGGIPYLVQLENIVPSAANLSYYLDIVKEKFLLRKTITVCAEVIGRVHDYEGDVETLMDEVERDILRIAESRVTTHMTPVKELVGMAISKIEDFFNRKGEITGMGTGFPDLDRLLDGMQNSEMFVIAARPSMGKTSLAMNIVEHVAVELKKPVGVFSLEMSAESLVLRMQCSLARVNLRSIREGFMSETDFPKLTAAGAKIANSNLYIDATPGLSILQLRARARRMAQQHDIKLFVVDYLQLLHSTNKRAKDNRQQEISDISCGLKALAKELRVPIVVLAQLNRELDKQKGRKPRLSDLRESGAIEQDADTVGLLYKPNETDDDDTTGQESAGLPVNLLIAKQRNGPTGDVNLTFLKSYTRFESAAKINDDDVPSDHQRRVDP